MDVFIDMSIPLVAGDWWIKDLVLRQSQANWSLPTHSATGASHCKWWRARARSASGPGGGFISWTGLLPRSSRRDRDCSTREIDTIDTSGDWFPNLLLRSVSKIQRCALWATVWN